jgi:hypothetical protein
MQRERKTGAAPPNPPEGTQEREARDKRACVSEALTYPNFERTRFGWERIGEPALSRQGAGRLDPPPMFGAYAEVGPGVGRFEI